MLQACFETVVKMSLTASFAALIIIPLKMLLQKLHLPRKVLIILWLIVGIRLLCPNAPQSNVSLFNAFENSKSSSPVQIHKQIKHTATYNITSNNTSNAGISKHENPGQNISCYMSLIWLFGLISFQGYALFQSFRLKKRLAYSLKLYDNIFESDKTTSSFVSGFFAPKIYIPMGCDDLDKENMIIHEKMHIRLWHNRLKTIAWIILCVHWFNPLVWLCFKLFSDDMEYVCDECAINKTDKKSYINSIIKASTCCQNKISAPDVCSFSSLSKQRICHLAQYKKHHVLCSVASFVICISAMLILNTNGIMSNPADASTTIIPTDALKYNAYVTDDVSNEKDTNPNDSNSLSHYTMADTKSTMPKVKVSVDQEVSPASDEDYVKNNLGAYKSLEKSDMAYAGFQHLEPENISSEHLTDELEQNSITPVQDNADLSKGYIKGEYVSSEEGVTIENVKCDNNGNISLYISLNTDSLFDVAVYDGGTGENVFQCMVLANGESTFSFLGFDENKTYDISLKEPTKGQWKTEGSYIIY